MAGWVKSVILSADDFGLSEAVNEGIERAHREGLLSTASLMIAGPAAADAIARARRLPELRVGLHLVVIEGPATLPPAEIPALVDPRGQFPSHQLRLGLRYFFGLDARRQLAAEIRAQFAAFAATGLRLDHANAHKHMHLHPTIGALLLRIGSGFGLQAVRVPAEPPGVLQECCEYNGFGDRLLHRWTSLLRYQVERAGMATTDHCFGIAWTGRMTTDRLLRLAGNLPDGSSEIYFHPAAGRDEQLDRLMPSYQHEAEMRSLIDPQFGAALRQAGALLVGFDALR